MRVNLHEIRPNNWYLDRTKLNRVRAAWDAGAEGQLPPVLVTEIDGQLALIDGHCRAYAALERGELDIEAVFEPLDRIEGSRALYEHIHRVGPGRGVTTLADLEHRVVDPLEHERLWIGYCERWLAERPEAGEGVDRDDTENGDR